MYRSWDDFRILNEVESAYAVVNLEARSKKLLWCNAAAAALFGTPVSEVLGTNLRAQNEAVNELQDEIFEAVQVRKETFETSQRFLDLWEMPKVHLKCKPVSVELPSGAKPLVLLKFNTKIAANSGEDWSRDMSTVVFPHVDVISTLFDMDSERRSAIFQNARAEAFYNNFPIHPAGRR